MSIIWGGIDGKDHANQRIVNHLGGRIQRLYTGWYVFLVGILAFWAGLAIATICRIGL